MPEESNEQAGLVFDVAPAEHMADLSDSDKETAMEQQEQETAMEQQEQDAAVPEASIASKDDAEEQCDVADVGAEHSVLVEEVVEGFGGRQTRTSKPAPVQLFQVTISVRDDWLHRGPALHDMDLNTYVSRKFNVKRRLSFTRHRTGTLDYSYLLMHITSWRATTRSK